MINKNKKYQSKLKKDKTNPINIHYFTYDDVKQSSSYLHISATEDY